MTSVSLTGIQRQSNAEYRAAIEAFRVSPDQGFAKLQDLGAIREIPYLERGQAVADAYREMSADPGKSVLVVAATHEEIGRVTHSIREDLKQSGVLGRSEMLQQHIPLQWTEAQKKDIANYQPGQVLVFHRSSHGVEKHEALAVTGAGDTVRTRNDRGEDVSLNLTQARSYSVHESRDIDVAVGDKLLLMSNRKEDGFRATNGELVTVRSVERGDIGLEDGRSLPSNYREFTHGYAVTAHRSQGKTVDKVIISADAMKQELFYVAASRGREDIAIVTSDANRLGESLGVSMARPSAMELASQIAQSVHAPEQGMAQPSGPSMPPSAPKFEISPEHGFGLGL
jgi:hypothetical protein